MHWLRHILSLEAQLSFLTQKLLIRFPLVLSQIMSSLKFLGVCVAHIIMIPKEISLVPEQSNAFFWAIHMDKNYGVSMTWKNEEFLFLKLWSFMKTYFFLSLRENKGHLSMSLRPHATLCYLTLLRSKINEPKPANSDTKSSLIQCTSKTTIPTIPTISPSSCN